jgi:MerR family transcriptional regulator, copper efflux regulator
MTETMHIGEFADRVGLSLRTIRHYEEIGLIAPSARTAGGFRLYTPTDEARFLVIRRMKPLGYSLDEMSAVLAVVDRLDADPASEDDRAALRAIHAEARERQERLRRQLAAADEFLDQLERRIES